MVDEMADISIHLGIHCELAVRVLVVKIKQVCHSFCIIVLASSFCLLICYYLSDKCIQITQNLSRALQAFCKKTTFPDLKKQNAL